MTRKKSFISMSDNNNLDSSDRITSYCPKCEGFGLKKLLGERIYNANEGPIPSDSDNWLQCHHCGTIIARVHAKHETKLKGFVELPDTIYDSGKTTITPVNKSRSRSRSKTIIKRESEDDIINKDLDAQRMLSQGKKLVNYTNIQSNNDSDISNK